MKKANKYFLALSIFILTGSSTIAGQRVIPSNPADIAGEWEALSSFPFEYGLLVIEDDGSGLLVLGENTLLKVETITFGDYPNDVILDFAPISTDKIKPISLRGGFKFLAQGLYLSLYGQGSEHSDESEFKFIFYRTSQLEEIRSKARDTIRKYRKMKK